MLPQHAPSLGVRVLSLDGGGAGALAELLILGRMMYRIKIEGNLDTEPSPCHYFELIAGSGTGGIIALMLGRMRMSVTDAIAAYEQLEPQFKTPLHKEFKATKFEECLQGVFGEGKMKDNSPNACKTFVCAMNLMNLNGVIPDLFRSYDSPEEPAIDCLIWEAARATSATPKFFKPMEIGRAGMKQLYVDGGVGNNNPTSLLLDEVKNIYPQRRIVLVASIGTGHPDTIRIPKSPSVSSLAKAMKEIATGCQKTHEDMARRFRSMPRTYFRFNVHQGLQSLNPQKGWKLADVSAHTESYLKMEETKSQLTEVAKIILNPTVPEDNPSPSTLINSVLPPIQRPRSHRTVFRGQLSRRTMLSGSNFGVYMKACPPPTPRFCGRDGILKKMAAYFDEHVGERHVFLLHGLGGSGKSQIAFKFVAQSAFPIPRFSDVYFIDGTSQQTIENDLTTLALVKNMTTMHDTLLWLAHQPEEWLLVYNNADDIHLNLAQFFPPCSHGNILITSRNPDLGQHADSQHKVDDMELENAIDLLLDTARYDKTLSENRDIAGRITQALHCLPLAVAQAGAYIASSQALHRYLDLYERTSQRIQLLKRRPPQSDYAFSVYTTWQISFDKLSPQAAQLLQLCGFIHHDDITEEIFQQAAMYGFGPASDRDNLQDATLFLGGFVDHSRQWDPLKFILVTDELGQYSLINFEAESRNVTFSIHPLVHEWCRTTAELDTPKETCMHKLMGMAISSMDPVLPFGRNIFPHVDALLFRNTEESGRQPNIKDLTFASAYLRPYCEEGRYTAGIRLANSMLHLGSTELNDRTTLDIQETLAVMYGEKGWLYAAGGRREFVLKRTSELMGENHPGTLHAMGNLVWSYFGLGKYRLTEGLNRTVLEQSRRLLRDEHPYTLWAMGNLAGTYFHLGKYRLAEELQRAVVEEKTRTVGNENADTLWAMRNLAAIYSALGNYDQAKNLRGFILEQKQRIWGKDHPETLWAMGYLAATCCELGKYALSEVLLLTVWEQRRRECGDEHPDTLNTTLGLAVTYYHQGKWDDTEYHLMVYLLHGRSRMGNKQNILCGLVHLAKTYSRKGLFEQAQILHITSIEGLERMLDSNHPDVLETRMHLATTFRDQGRFKEAARVGGGVVQRMLESDVLGYAHPTTLRAQTELAATFREHGFLEDAMKLGAEALHMQKSVLGEEHPDTLRSMASLGLTYHAMNRLHKAQELLDQALQIQRRVLRPGHPDTQENALNLNVTLQRLGMDQDSNMDQDSDASMDGGLGGELPGAQHDALDMGGMLRELGMGEPPAAPWGAPGTPWASAANVPLPGVRPTDYSTPYGAWPGGYSRPYVAANFLAGVRPLDPRADPWLAAGTPWASASNVPLPGVRPTDYSTPYGTGPAGYSSPYAPANFFGPGVGPTGYFTPAMASSVPLPGTRSPQAYYYPSTPYAPASDVPLPSFTGYSSPYAPAVPPWTTGYSTPYGPASSVPSPGPRAASVPLYNTQENASTSGFYGGEHRTGTSTPTDSRESSIDPREFSAALSTPADPTDMNAILGEIGMNPEARTHGPIESENALQLSVPPQDLDQETG
ncbi:hypothetical protein FB451DRAFT_1222817 [Mycena latifolia]|nr:hypothetical protein FB451DRAFT_1222817 [Mycena latifolia]